MLTFPVYLISALLASPISLKDLAGSVIPSQYIIIFKQDTPAHKLDLHWKWLEEVLEPVLPKASMLTMQEDPRVQSYLNSEAAAYWDIFGIMHKYAIDGMNGYSARLPSFVVTLLKNHGDIELVEEDVVMTISEDAPSPDENQQNNTPGNVFILIISLGISQDCKQRFTKICEQELYFSFFCWKRCYCLYY
jgi:Peptidase inhibitor I9